MIVLKTKQTDNELKIFEVKKILSQAKINLLYDIVKESTNFRGMQIAEEKLNTIEHLEKSLGEILVVVIKEEDI